MSKNSDDKRPCTTVTDGKRFIPLTSGQWVDFDETESLSPIDPAATLAFLNAAEGVNFVNEFVRQYAEQQGYPDERTRLLEKKAHDAITRNQEYREGAKLRLVSHIDGLAIDDPTKRDREAFWMLTNGKEFNAFLEAANEPARWHDPSKPAPKPELETPSKNPILRYDHPLDTPIWNAIREAGGANAKPKKVIDILQKMAHPTDDYEPATPFIKLRWTEGEPEWLYVNDSDTTDSIKLNAMKKKIAYRLKKMRENAFDATKMTHGKAK